MKRISVIICTYNRSSILKECIMSLIKNNFDQINKFDIVVVDNNSKDNTKDIISDLMKDNGNIKYYFEPVQGLSVARNRGIKEAETDIVVFIDDDVIVHKNFIIGILNYFDENQDVVCGAGKINTIWSDNRPNWFNDGFYSIIGETKYGEKYRELTGNEYPYGGNMFFKRDIFDEIGTFDTELGVNGDNVVMGEEVDLCTRIKGKSIFYLPNVVVDHRVHVNKVDKQYILKRYEEEGKVAAAIAKDECKNIKMYMMKRIGILLLRDYPLYIISKIKNKHNEFYAYSKIKRNLSILKALKN